jgi:hypothetical protein
MSNASLISSNEVIKWYWAECAAAVIGSTALAWVHNGAATAELVSQSPMPAGNALAGDKAPYATFMADVPLNTTYSR